MPAPENGFRSLTRYDADYLFVPNELDRYTRSLRFDFTYNADAALDPYIQKNSPGQDKEAYVTHRHRLVAAEIPRQVVNSMMRRIAISPALSVLAMAASFWDVWAGKLLFLAIPLCYLSHRLVDASWHQRPDDVEDQPLPRSPAQDE
jgi:hypothetical protein